jgi:inner membrane protein
MDPVSQGALGAALPQSIRARWSGRRKTHAALAGFLGMLGGMAADLDILISSNADPLLFLTYHRQFTHSFVFIPFGGFIVALFLHGILRRRWTIGFWQTALLCSLGYATHALLDSATSYGTMLLWPFSETRFSWSIISIVDPLFTLPLLVSVLMAGIRDEPRYARIGLVWALLYLGAGWFQHQAAREIGENLAASRGHTPLRHEIKPSIGNLLVWRSVYESEDRFFVDAVRAGLAPKVFEGTSVLKLHLARDFPWLEPDSQQARDIGRFGHFSDGFTAVDPAKPNRILDVRYAFVPNEVNALFSIELSEEAGPTEHVRYQPHRQNAREQFDRLWRMMVDGGSGN